MFLLKIIFLLISFINTSSLIENYPKRENFQTELNGKKVDLYFLTNSNGYEISITNYGGIIVSIMIPNNNNQFENILQSYSSIEEYIHNSNQKNKNKINSLLGQYANQIKDNEFILDNKTYKLNNSNYISNLGEKVWTPVQINSSELRLYYTSQEGENGFPGKLHIEVIYCLNDNNEFKISYTAITTQKTVINLSQRLFFNLNGDINQEINNHILYLNSKLYLPSDENKIPSGDIKLIDNTIYDFKKGKKLGEQNLDDYFILDKKIFDKNKKYNFGSLLEDKKSGRKIEMYTTEPGVHIISDKLGISIEPKHFPNSPNVGFFPSTILKPGDLYKKETIYRFNMEKD